MTSEALAISTLFQHGLESIMARSLHSHNTQTVDDDELDGVETKRRYTDALCCERSTF